MRRIALFLAGCLLLLTLGCQTAYVEYREPTATEQQIEAILLGMSQKRGLDLWGILQDETQFRQVDEELELYEATVPLQVFSFRATHLSRKGFPHLEGPYVTLLAPPSTVAKRLQWNYGIDFVERDGIYFATLANGAMVSVFADPAGYRSSIVSCVYDPDF